MWLHIGYGTLVGASIGFAFVLLNIAWLWVKLLLLLYGPVPVTDAKRNANIYFAFDVDGLFRYFRERPIVGPLSIYSPPILLGAVLGFAVENVWRLF